MTRRRSLIADGFFKVAGGVFLDTIGLGYERQVGAWAAGEQATANGVRQVAGRNGLVARSTRSRAMELRRGSQDHQVVPVHRFAAGPLPPADFLAREFANAAGKFRPVQIANAHDVPAGELAFATGDARTEQALARFPQGLPRAVIHKQRALGMVKKCDPAFAPFSQ